jgi:outer membrane protein assembly factor BamA
LSLDTRPGINLGVTSNGNFLGGTDLTFTDVLGDKQLNFFMSSESSYRTMAIGYTNIERRLQYAVQAFSQEQYFFSDQNSYALYDPALAPFVDQDDALGTSRVRGATLFGIYPFNRYARVEVTGSYYNLREQYNDEVLGEFADQFQQETYDSLLLRTGNMMPFGLALTRETTVFREFGPIAGSTQRLEYSIAPSIGSFLSRQTVDGEVRRYFRLATTGVLAARFRGFKSWGDFPDFTYFGGNADLHGYGYRSLVGQKAFYANAQLRFPILEATLTPLGQMGGVRGMFFFDVGGAGFNDTPFTIASRKPVTYTPSAQIVFDPLTGFPSLVQGAPRPISGFRLVDARASYGFGFETFVLGYPMHFDFSWRTLFNKQWEEALFSLNGGSAAFRARKFSFWIGYDW